MSTPPAVSSGPSHVPRGTLAFVVVLSIFWVVQGTLTYQRARHHDFLSFYTGATLIGRGEAENLYDLDAQRPIQESLAPANEDVIPFIRPSYYALLLAPLSLLPFGAAFWVWIVLQALLLFGCWAWAGRYFGWDAMIFGAIYFPTAAGVTNAQDCVFLLAVGIGAYVLAERERDYWSGLVLGLGLIKFHLFFLLPVVILVQKRFKIFAGYCTTGIIALGIFLGLGGFGGVEKYVSLLRRDDLEWLSPAPELMINIQSVAANLGLHSPWAAALLIVLVAGITVFGAWRVSLWRWLSVALLGSVLITPHAYAYDAAILLLPVWLVLFRSDNPLLRIAAATLAVPLPFLSFLFGPPWTVIPALTIFTFLCLLAWDNHRTRRAEAAA